MRLIARLRSASADPVTLLRVLLAASIAGPALLFVFTSWLAWCAAMDDALRDLGRTAEVAREQASKVFEGQSQLADRVNDLVRDLGEAEIVAQEGRLHDQLAAIVAHLPQIQTVLLAAPDGHPLVSAGTYPVPRDLDLSARDYFQAVVHGYDGTFVSRVQIGDINRQPFFGLSRPALRADGQIMGVIDVAVSPVFFRDFYHVLATENGGDATGEAVVLVRDDGQELVRSPDPPGAPSMLRPDNPFFASIAAAPDSGIFRHRSVIEKGAPVRFFAYRRVQGYPLYVVAGRSRQAIRAVWERELGGHLIFGVPATLALFVVTWTALRRARREQEALARAQQEMQRREQVEAQLLRATRLDAVGQMTGGVAHDFNNLLTVIVGNVEMIDRRADDPARVRRLAGNVLLAARRGAEVTQQLLAFSRRQLVKPEIVDLNRRLHEFRPLLEQAVRETIRIDFSPAATLAPVRLDPGQFEAAVLNLVCNARDAMPEGGRVTIATSNVVLRAGEQAELAAGAYVRVCVTDTGTGMDAATAAKAFEPFFTTKEIGHGTGLGLSQVYGFVKQAGGDVRIATVPGDGTSVAMFLPVTAEELPRDAGQGDRTTRRLRAGEVVLVVEDEPAVLEMAVETLEELGYVTLTARDGDEALRQLRDAVRVDVLFSDVVMPGSTNGVQLSLEAKRLRPGLKVLLTSGYTAEAFGRELPPGVRLLSKPYDRRQLAEELEKEARSF